MSVCTPKKHIQIGQKVTTPEAQLNYTQKNSVISAKLSFKVKSEPIDELGSKLSDTSDIDDSSDVNPKIPLVLSPTGTASTASSPGTADDIWDSPLSSSNRLKSAFSDVALTPLTPLTPQPARCVSPDASPVPRAHKALRGERVKREVTSDTSADLNASHSAKTSRPIEPTQAEGYFYNTPKLFRNLTREFKASTDDNPTAAQAGYNRSPEFNFGSIPAAKTSTRSHRATVVTQKNAKNELKVNTRIPCAAPTSVNNNLPRAWTTSNLTHDFLEHIVPLNIHSRVLENSEKCVASLVKKPNTRCTYSCSGSSIDTITRSLSKCNVELDLEGFLQQIDQLIEAAMCGHHRKPARAKKRQEKLKDLVEGFTELPDAERAEFQAWMDAIAPRHLHTGVPTPMARVSRVDTNVAAIQTFKIPEEPTLPSMKQDTPASDARKQSPLSKFQDYQPEITKNKSISSALLEEIQKPLGKLSLKDGFIYVFWDKEHFGKVKIGRTNNLERRLKEWDKKCNRKHMYHPVSQREGPQMMPHVNRIERLIHLELKECRKQTYCSSCKKNHTEWFEVGEALVTEIYNKWKEWIMRKPYALDIVSGKWVLRPEMVETLEQVCKPVCLVEKKPPLRRVSGAKGRRSSGRRSM